MNAASREPYDIDAKSDNGSATIIQIDASKHALIIVIAALVCGLCLALTLSMYVNTTKREETVNNKLIISENHWRNLEVDSKVMRAELDQFKRSK